MKFNQYNSVTSKIGSGQSNILRLLLKKLPHILLALPVSMAAPCFAATACDSVSSDLLEMERKDQAVRIELTKAMQSASPSEENIASISERQNTIDAENTSRLKNILSQCGWPKTEQDSHRAWLLVQHADNEPEFQHEAIRLLGEAVANGYGAAKDLAYLVDRVAVAEDRLQEYGTQFGLADRCTLVLKPIDNREAVNRRRAELKMESLEDYEARVREFYLPQDCGISKK